MDGGGFGGEHDLAGGGELALIRQLDLDDLGTFFPEGGDGFVEHARHLGIEVVDIEGGRHADPHTLERACGRGHVVRHRERRGGGILRVSTGHQPDQQCAIFDRLREWADRIERLRQGHRAGAADQADRGLEAGDAAEMRGHPDRAAGIRAKRRKGQPGRDRRARAGR